MQKYHDMNQRVLCKTPSMNVYEYDSLVIMAKNLEINLYEIKTSLLQCCSDNLLGENGFGIFRLVESPKDLAVHNACRAGENPAFTSSDFLLDSVIVQKCSVRPNTVYYNYNTFTKYYCYLRASVTVLSVITANLNRTC